MKLKKKKSIEPENFEDYGTDFEDSEEEREKEKAAKIEEEK